MKYSEARSRIKSGDILAFSHRAPWYRSWYDFKICMVRMFTRSEYSHIALAWVIGSGDGKRVFILEAVKPLVRIYPLSNIGEDFYWLPMRAPWKSNTKSIAFSKIGKPYSEIVALEAFFKELPENTVSECAAYVKCVLAADGIELGHRATPDAVVRAAQMRDGAEMFYVMMESAK